MLAALLRLHHRPLAHPPDEAEPHIGDGRRTVKAALGFHLRMMCSSASFSFDRAQAFEHQLVALGQLARGEARRDARALGVIFDERHDAVQAPVHGTAVLVGRAEILAHGRLLEARDVQRMVHQLADALVFDAEMGTTGMPSSFSISFTWMVPPLPSTSSIMLRASTMGA